MSRLLAYGVGLGVLAAAAFPALCSVASIDSADSYPLSTYPMFGHPSERPVLFFAEGLRRKGKAVRLEPSLIASDEVLQAAVSIRRAVEGGAKTERALCKHIAERVADSTDLRGITRVRLVSASYDPIGYFTRSPEPLERKILHECKVSRKEHP